MLKRAKTSPEMFLCCQKKPEKSSLGSSYDFTGKTLPVLSRHLLLGAEEFPHRPFWKIKLVPWLKDKKHEKLT